MRTRSRVHCAGAVLLVVALSGCSLARPQPWEKDLLARPEMAIGGDSLGVRLRQHVYSSREGSSGGDSVGGGGCGCN